MSNSYDPSGDAPSLKAAAANALKAGTDMNCGAAFGLLGAALKDGLVDTDDLDTAIARTLLTRFELGLFDPPESNPFTAIPYVQKGVVQNGCVGSLA